ncbi:efflux RND transporter periplasmic adaptor subunit [Hydrogenophaga sp. OTU3427]|uniref:efflux RND transporter periplasmic adaptor subunit n=1 Tax=Hydrogenophaga sp. OTU3427 TaxID=3043856 RepID=UPI00313B4DF7
MKSPLVKAVGRLAPFPLLAWALVACSPPPPAEEPVRAVKVVTVAAGALGATSEYAGEVRARTESRLGFRVAGKLIERPAQVGQVVKAGQLLARLDAQDYALGVQSATAGQQAAQTQRDLAAADLKRYVELKNQGFVSGAEIERREATLRSADASLAQAKAQLALQGNQSAYAALRAEAAGVVLAVEAEPGQVLTAGTPVLRVAHDGPRDVVFAVPEDRLAGLKLGQPVQVRLWSGGDALAGQVREIAASADAATRTYQVKVGLPAGAPLPLGATAYAQMAPAAGVPRQAIKLPTSALRQAGKGTAVWLFDAASGTVRSQPVQVAAADGNDAVIATGLKGGEQVVVAGVHVLNEGQKVSLYSPRGGDKPAAQ